MNKRVGVGVLGVFFAVACASVYADSDDDNGNRQRFSQKPTKVAVDPAYIKDCGACHLAFPPSFLPSGSWVRIMAELDKHFGDNAELPPAAHDAISQYLAQNAADKTTIPRGERVMRGVNPESPPLRLTETPYFRRLHHEVPNNVFKKSAELKSFANCGGCHPRADQGNFSEHEVKIPGYPNWD